jgi:hypothetical protein
MLVGPGHHAHHERSRRGLLLVAMLLALALLGLAIVVLVVAGGQLSDIDRRRLDAYRAEYNADAASALALREIAASNDRDGDGTIGGISDDASAATGPILNGYRVNADATVSSTSTTVRVADPIFEARRPIELTVQRPASSGFFPGLFVEGWKINGWVTIATSTSNGLFNTTPRWRGWMIDPFLPNLGNGDRIFIGQPTDGYMLRFTGFITIPQSGSWTFGTTSDDGSTVWINGQQVVANDFGQAPTFRSGSAVSLNAGTYPFEMYFWDGGGGHSLQVQWSGPGITGWQTIPHTAFTCNLPQDTRMPRMALQEQANFFGESWPAFPVRLQAWPSSQGPFQDSLAQANLAHVSVNQSSASRIRLSSLVQAGNMLSLPGSDPNTVVSVEGSVAYDGRSTQQSESVTMVHRSRDVPATSPDLSLWGNLTETWSSSFRVNNLNLWNQSRAIINGDITVYVDNALTMTDTSQIEIPAGSRLRLIVGEAMTLNNSAIINPSGLPSRLILIKTGTGALTLNSDAQLHGYTFGQALPVVMYNQSTISGTLAARTLEMTARSRFHQDLGNSSGGSGNALRITSWAGVNP